MLQAIKLTGETAGNVVIEQAMDDVYASVKRGGSLAVALPPTHNAFIYLLDGALRFPDGTTASGLHQVVFATDGGGIQFEALEDTRGLLLSGEPLGETIVSYGPFVMNTDDEIRTAFRDYRSGKMGFVP